MLRLHCEAQNYAWGRLGEESEVAKLHSSGTGAIVTAATPYAELWMGTHPSGPSLVSFASDEEGAGENKLLLSDWLRQHPQALGSATLSKWHGELPFLFKVQQQSLTRGKVQSPQDRSGSYWESSQIGIEMKGSEFAQPKLTAQPTSAFLV